MSQSYLCWDGGGPGPGGADNHCSGVGYQAGAGQRPHSLNLTPPSSSTDHHLSQDNVIRTRKKKFFFQSSMKRLSYWTLECLLRPLVEPFNVWSTSSALMSCDLWPRSQGLILVSPMSPVNWLPILENICKFLPMKLFRWMGTATMRIIKWSWSLFWLSRDVSEQKKTTTRSLALFLSAAGSSHDCFKISHNLGISVEIISADGGEIDCLVSQISAALFPPHININKVPDKWRYLFASGQHQQIVLWVMTPGVARLQSTLTFSSLNSEHLKLCCPGHKWYFLIKTDRYCHLEDKV